MCSATAPAGSSGRPEGVVAQARKASRRKEGRRRLRRRDGEAKRPPATARSPPAVTCHDAHSPDAHEGCRSRPRRLTHVVRHASRVAPSSGRPSRRRRDICLFFFRRQPIARPRPAGRRRAHAVVTALASCRRRRRGGELPSRPRVRPSARAPPAIDEMRTYAKKNDDDDDDGTGRS